MSDRRIRSRRRSPGAQGLLAAIPVLVAAVVLAVVLGAGGSGHRAQVKRPVPRSVNRRQLLDPLATGDHVALGVNLDGPPVQAAESFTKLVGAAPRIVMWFQTWDEPLLYASDVSAAQAIGATPMITWDPLINGVGIPLSQIAAGRYDSYIRGAARAAKAYGHLIYIRLAHEMNLPSSAYGPGRNGNTPAEFIAAWRHVVDIFRALDVVNAEFVWSPNTDCTGHCPFTAFYPGDAWVDWVALDGYNYGPVNNDRWMTFGQLFGSSYGAVTRLTGRPLMIGETATTNLGGDKAAWIRGMARTLATQFRRVRALIWFQRRKETDWRVNSSSSSLDAFRSMLKSFPFS